jgi:hypothetical protein
MAPLLPRGRPVRFVVLTCDLGRSRRRRYCCWQPAARISPCGSCSEYALSGAAVGVAPGGCYSVGGGTPGRAAPLLLDFGPDPGGPSCLMLSAPAGAVPAVRAARAQRAGGSRGNGRGDAAVRNHRCQAGGHYRTGLLQRRPQRQRQHPAAAASAMSRCCMPGLPPIRVEAGRQRVQPSCGRIPWAPRSHSTQMTAAPWRSAVVARAVGDRAGATHRRLCGRRHPAWHASDSALVP